MTLTIKGLEIITLIKKKIMYFISFYDDLVATYKLVKYLSTL
jgi:hypothetical protein